MSGPHRLSENFLHLGLGATAVPQPPFDGFEWYEAYGARHGETGAMVLTQEFPDGAREQVTLRSGDYAINPPGVWHIADVEESATAIFITAGEGTQHRTR